MFTRTIDFLRELVAIDSVNPSLVPGGAGEQQIAEAIAREMRAIGVDVELQPVEPGRPNVIAVLEGRRAGPTLVLCGHLDTVGVAGMSAPFDPVVRDNRVYGRGAEDMKGGLAAIVGAVRKLADAGGLEAGRVVVAGVADEEDASRGAEAFAARWRCDPARPVPNAAIVAEPTDLRVGIAHKGFAWLRITTTGRAAHGSRPREGRDAILWMGRLLARLDAYDRARQQQRGHPLLGPPSLHASFIEGGGEWSTYPDRCLLRLERRTIPGEDPDEPVREISRILESLVQEDEQFRASVELVFARRAPMRCAECRSGPTPGSLAKPASRRCCSDPGAPASTESRNTCESTTCSRVKTRWQRSRARSAPEIATRSSVPWSRAIARAP